MIWPKRILGVTALLFGIAILGWFVFNLVHPTAEFKSSFRTPFQLIVPIVFVIYGWRWLHYEGRGIEETPPNFDCAELRESVGRARESLPYFISRVQENVDGAFAKFPIRTPQGLTEHIWGYVHSYQNGTVNVSLANKPKDPNEPDSGRRSIRIEEVEDWQIMQPDGKIKGAYSLVALFRYRENQGEKLSPRMQKQKGQLIDATYEPQIPRT